MKNEKIKMKSFVNFAEDPENKAVLSEGRLNRNQKDEYDLVWSLLHEEIIFAQKRREYDNELLDAFINAVLNNKVDYTCVRAAY